MKQRVLTAVLLAAVCMSESSAFAAEKAAGAPVIDVREKTPHMSERQEFFRMYASVVVDRSDEKKFVLYDCNFNNERYRSEGIKQVVLTDAVINRIKYEKTCYAGQLSMAVPGLGDYEIIIRGYRQVEGILESRVITYNELEKYLKQGAQLVMPGMLDTYFYSKKLRRISEAQWKLVSAAEDSDVVMGADASDSIHKKIVADVVNELISAIEENGAHVMGDLAYRVVKDVYNAVRKSHGVCVV